MRGGFIGSAIGAALAEEAVSGQMAGASAGVATVTGVGAVAAVFITDTDALELPVNVQLAETFVHLSPGDARALRQANKALFRSVFNE